METTSDEHIQVFYMNVKFRNKMIFLLLYAKNTKSMTKMTFKNIFADHCICSFFREHKKIYFTTKFVMYVENLYMSL